MLRQSLHFIGRHVVGVKPPRRASAGWAQSCVPVGSKCFATVPGTNNVDATDGSAMSPSLPNYRRPMTSSPTPSSALGSMDDQGWDEALEGVLTHVAKAFEHSTSGVYWMNRADKILSRLQAEVATQSAVARARGLRDVQSAQLQVLHGWATLGRQNPEQRMVGERASRIFWNIVQRSPTAWWKKEAVDQEMEHNQSILVNALLDMLEMHARQEYLSDKDLEQATNLLLWKDLPELNLDTADIGPMYGIIMQQVQVVHQDETTFALLQRQWQQISDQDITQWYLEVASPKSDESSLDSLESQSSSHVMNQRTLSSFESERLVHQTVTLLQSNNPADRARIEKIIGQWEKLISSGATKQNIVVNVILDYYARSGDTTNAIKWLAKLDLVNPSDPPKGLNQLIISLAEKDDPSAIWRAEEILRKLEASGGGNALDSSAYAAVAERWLKTNESQAHRRVMELCFRPDKFDARLVSVLLRGLRREKEVSAEMVNQLLTWFARQNESIEEEARRDLVEGLLFVLQRHGDDWQGWNFFTSQLDSGLLVNEKLSELAVASIPHSVGPDKVIEVYQLLIGKGVDLGIGFFVEAAKPLADLRGTERLDHLMTLYEGVIDRLKRGTIDPKSTTLAIFLKSLFELINYWKRDDVALKLIRQIETVEGSEIPMFCYSTTANTLSFKGKLKETAALYRRLKELYSAGHKNLYPDATFMLNYARVLSTDSIANSAKIQVILNKQLSLLEELKTQYESTGDNQYKPLPNMYKTLLSTITKMKPTEEISLTAESLLNEMITMGAVQLDDADPFSMVMHVILQSPRLDSFKAILELCHQMKDIGYTDHSELVVINILRACTRTQSKEEQEEALELALSTLSLFRKNLPSDAAAASPHGPRVYSLVFASLLRNFGHQDTRLYPILQRVFQYCCQDGYVTDQIVEQISQGKKVSKSFFKKLYEDQLLYGNRVPPEWSRNVAVAQEEGEQVVEHY